MSDPSCSLQACTFGGTCPSSRPRQGDPSLTQSLSFLLFSLRAIRLSLSKLDVYMSARFLKFSFSGELTLLNLVVLFLAVLPPSLTVTHSHPSPSSLILVSYPLPLLTETLPLNLLPLAPALTSLYLSLSVIASLKKRRVFNRLPILLSSLCCFPPYELGILFPIYPNLFFFASFFLVKFNFPVPSGLVCLFLFSLCLRTKIVLMTGSDIMTSL